MSRYEPLPDSCSIRLLRMTKDPESEEVSYNLDIEAHEYTLPTANAETPLCLRGAYLAVEIGVS